MKTDLLTVKYGCSLLPFTHTHTHTHTCTPPQLLGVTAVVLVFLWRSRGVTILDPNMNQGSYSFRDHFIGYIAVACVSILYSVVMTTLGMGGLNIPPILVSCQWLHLCLHQQWKGSHPNIMA